MADLLDRATRTGTILRDGSSYDQRGRLTLMTTSRTSHARSGRGAERLRVKIRRRLGSKLRADGNSRRPRVALINAGFCVLVALTTWVIASASVWWVPVYVIVLITIFVVPRKGQLLSSASITDAKCDAVGMADLEPGLRVDCANGADQLRSDSVLVEGEWTESSNSKPDPGPVSMPKQRRSRVQVRKSVPVTERVTGSVPVVWIQAGPGKFVRVEGGLSAVNSAEIANVSSQAYPATDIAAEVIEAVPTEAVLPAEQTPPESVGVIPTDVEQSSISANRVSGSVTEEYGIAPSAFSLTPERKTEARRRVLWHSRDLVGVVAKLGRVSRRRVSRTSSGFRRSVGSRFAPNVPRQHAANRASGRMRHVSRDLRTRSPPGLLRVQGTGVTG
jgi:hypothetical protein